MRRIFLVILAILGLVAPAQAHDIGPPVGSKAPALTARMADGRAAVMSALTGDKGVVLVFFRSAKWCPFCQAQLLSLKGAPAELAKRGYRLAAISYDPPEVLAKFSSERGLDYPLLSDGNSKTIDAFGLRDPQYPPDSMAYGVPQPGMFVIGRDGVIKAKLAEQGYRTRPPLSALLATIDALPAR